MNVTDFKWKLTVSQCLDKGGRNHMEDFCYCHIEKDNENALFGFFGIFDGHGGSDAANFVQQTFKDELMKIDKFWSNDNADVLESIRMVYWKIQNLMWIDRENWPKTISGYKSTAGTTATIAIIRNGVLYTGHVGDSAIVLVYKDDDGVFHSEELTQEHKPDNPVEKKRIEDSGGSLRKKAGIDRVVWNRRKLFNKSNEIDYIPFLAVARSLGDLWSYDSKTDKYHVSPEPDIKCVNLDCNSHRAIIMGSDGLWNVISRETSVKLINLCNFWYKKDIIYNPAQVLVNYCLYQWQRRNIKADNISAVVVLLEPDCSNDNSQLGSLKISEDLSHLYSELLSNNLLINCIDSVSQVLLDNFQHFSSFQKAINKPLNNDEQVIELLKMYLKSDINLAQFCKSWSDSSTHWYLLYRGFRNLGLTSFPNIISYIDTNASTDVQDLLIAFPWSVCCLELLDSMSLNNRVRNYIQHKQLLSEFWLSFYKIVVKPNFQFLDVNQTNKSTIDTMKNILLTKSADINDWVMSSTCTNSEFFITSETNYRCSSNKTAKFSLKKSSTCMSYSSVNDFFSKKPIANDEFSSKNVYECFQLKRSASFDISKSQLYCNIRTSIISLNGTGSTTPINVSSDCDITAASPASIPEIKNLEMKKRHCVPFSLKRKISNNLTQLIFLPCKETPDNRKRKIIKRVSSKKKRFML